MQPSKPKGTPYKGRVGPVFEVDIGDADFETSDLPTSTSYQQTVKRAALPDMPSRRTVDESFDGVPASTIKGEGREQRENRRNDLLAQQKSWPAAENKPFKMKTPADLGLNSPNMLSNVKKADVNKSRSSKVLLEDVLASGDMSAAELRSTSKYAKGEDGDAIRFNTHPDDLLLRASAFEAVGNVGEGVQQSGADVADSSSVSSEEIDAMLGSHERSFGTTPFLTVKPKENSWWDNLKNSISSLLGFGKDNTYVPYGRSSAAALSSAPPLPETRGKSSQNDQSWFSRVVNAIFGGKKNTEYKDNKQRDRSNSTISDVSIESIGAFSEAFSALSKDKLMGPPVLSAADDSASPAPAISQSREVQVEQEKEEPGLIGSMFSAVVKFLKSAMASTGSGFEGMGDQVQRDNMDSRMGKNTAFGLDNGVGIEMDTDFGAEITVSRKASFSKAAVDGAQEVGPALPALPGDVKPGSRRNSLTG